MIGVIGAHDFAAISKAAGVVPGRGNAMADTLARIAARDGSAKRALALAAVAKGAGLDGQTFKRFVAQSNNGLTVDGLRRAIARSRTDGVRAASADKPGSTDARISISGPIGEGGVTVKSVQSALSQTDAAATTLTVDLSSPGGDPTTAIAMAHALKAWRRLRAGRRIVVRGTGIVASAATLVAYAADPGELGMTADTFWLAHFTSLTAQGTADELRTAASTLDTIDRQIVATYTARTGKSEQAVRDAMARDVLIDAAQAKRDGWIDKVLPSIAKASASASMLPDRWVATLSEASRTRLLEMRLAESKAGATQLVDVEYINRTNSVLAHVARVRAHNVAKRG